MLAGVSQMSLLRRISPRLTRQMGDLADAVHNIPGLVLSWEHCCEDALRQSLWFYDRKWKSEDDPTRLLAVYEEGLRGSRRWLCCPNETSRGWNEETLSALADDDPKSARRSVGERVSVVLNERNRTPREGEIRARVFHHKQRRWHYYLVENGKDVKKRYRYADLRSAAYRCDSE